VECERAFSLIKSGQNSNILKEKGPYDSMITPKFQLELKNPNIILIFTFFPGFGRWNKDILSLIHNRGGVLREAPDVVITRESPFSEEPILAIEYCSALPAGNNAWQRNGRAYSLGCAGIPYAYINELGGFELGKDRAVKSSRNPNPAVPFSYLCSLHTLNKPIYPVFISSPTATHESKIKFSKVFGYSELSSLIKSLIMNESIKETESRLEKKALELVCLLASNKRGNDSFTSEEWKGAYESDLLLTTYIQSVPHRKWKKKAYIKGLTASAKSLMASVADISIGLTSSELPFCLVPASKRLDFIKIINDLYGDLDPQFNTWLSRENDLVICWIMGFKPRGDDARPDRGLPPLCRMLIGDSIDMLTVVYGPVPPYHLKLLETNPAALMARNGLWESILALSNAVLIDSETIISNVKNAYTQDQWSSSLSAEPQSNIIISSIPARFREDDIDTMLHLLFCHLSNQSGINIFEGLCNPPGGDWSGISLLTADNKKELRWISLPRVSGENTKRPDHVFQIIDPIYNSIILIIESKENASDLENNIGSKLKTYVSDLICSPPSVERDAGTDWTQTRLEKYPDGIEFASAAAFIANSNQNIESIANKYDVDLIFGFRFNSDTSCTIISYPRTELGAYIQNIIKKFKLFELNVNIVFR